MKSKTIILSSTEESKNGRGILTLYTEDDLLKCKLRLYNVEKLSKDCRIGIFHLNQVYTANLLEKNGTYESSLVGDFDIMQDFYTAIINTNNNNQVIIAGGTYAGHFFNDTTVFEDLNQSDESTRCLDHAKYNTERDVSDTLNITSNTQHNTPCISECSEAEPNNLTQDKCANCIYKQCFYENKSNEKLDILTSQPSQDETPCSSECGEAEPKNIESELSGQKTSEIKKQIAELIINNPQNTELICLIENSNFAKLEENGKEYSIGAIYENQEIKYLCYAVKSNYNSPPPEEIGKHYQWLPIDKEDPLTDGYYMVFQDATDLKILEF